MKRRTFIALLGAVPAWPLAARAQPADSMRRIALMMPYAESDSESQIRIAALRDSLEKLGWTSRNIRVEYRWDIGNPERARTVAKELVATAPDLIMPSTDREAKPHAQKGRQQNQVCEIRKDPDLTGYPANEGELQSQNAERGEAKLEASGSAAESFFELSGFSLPEPAPRSFYGILCLARFYRDSTRLRLPRHPVIW